MIDLAKLAIQAPEILLPRPDIDLAKWAVIACDQYTSEPEYWQEVDRLVGDAPSTLRLTFPEVYLEEADAEARIAAINCSMDAYLADGLLAAQPAGFVLLDRKTAHAPSRKGLMVALDLEQYDYRPGSKTLIRATEGTIVDRLPPRIRVRQNASIELPHIMVLIDDPERTVIEPLFAEQLPELYDVELMQNGGRLRGWQVAEPRLLAQVGEALARLAEPERFRQRYAVDDQEVMLYAMGDGNHSFATAKAIWEQLKAEAADPAAIMDHPARYALVELVNLHDPGLEFEAIHRVLFDVDPTDLLSAADRFFAAAGTPCRFQTMPDQARAEATAEAALGHAIPLSTAAGWGLLSVDQPNLTLVVATLQSFLDDYLGQRPTTRIDYIHGAETVSRLGQRPASVGFLLPAISKHDLFRTIVRDGALPRKTFSMGEADEKRFYLEARKIVR
ncbi:MAG: DUF1015 domain-containing protein [Desulfuromonadales bacterium]|nr:DUF1015 domain-containing protein [Desulfuromonadales bacterium]